MSTPAPQLVPRTIFLIGVVLILAPLLPMLLTGRWDWWQAWVFAVVYILSFIISRVLAARRTPDILAERMRSMDMADAKPWDRVLSPIVALGGFLVPLVAGLDVRAGWSAPFSLPVELAGLAGYLAGIVIASWALIENAYFSGVVRIQTDRGQHVVSSGPYAIIRHPGYLGAIVTYLGIPLLLDSAWALVPAVVISALLVLRTALEDRTLQAELPGYAGYTKKVKFRLFPGVW